MSFNHPDVPPAIDSLLDCSEPFDLIEVAMANCFDDTPFARRIRNALELTSQADEIVSEAVALSLSVSALEALLCSSKDKKKQALQSRIPVLLGADQKLAEDSASAIGLLYELRSQCIHGEDMSVPREVAAARKLVSAVLRAALKWDNRETDSPDQDEDSAWMTELKSASSASRPVAGVNKELAEHLRSFTHAFDRDRVKELFDENDNE